MVNSRRAPFQPGTTEEPAAPELAATLRQEREAREQAESALRQAQQTIRQLQAQLAHADIAHAESLAAEQHARERAEELAREAQERFDRLSKAAPHRKARQAASEPEGAASEDATLEVDDGEAPVEWWRPGWRNLRA